MAVGTTGSGRYLIGDYVGADVVRNEITAQATAAVNIDPEVDTPEVLKKYSEQYRTGPGWTFLTGKESDITLLRKKLGMYDED